MDNHTIVIERLFNSSKDKIWKALTDPAEIKDWFYDFGDFKAEVGFKFQFSGGHKDDVHYLHLCEVTEVIPGTMLSYSWRYEGYPGISIVKFELTDESGKTLLILKHSGIDTFPKDNPHFSLLNFKDGWSQLINKLSKSHPEQNNYELNTIIEAPVHQVFKGITEEIPSWWTSMFEGESKNSRDVFTVRFGNSVFKTMLVKEIISDKIIVWEVIDTLIDLPELQNKKEWLHTTIEWHMSEQGDKTNLLLKHIGLTPDVGCYRICSDGWHSFVTSLKAYLETGTGTPFVGS